MSRVAKNPITIPDTASVTVDNNIVKVKGTKGELEFNMHSLVSLEINENVITVNYDEENQQSIALAGTTRSIVNNMVIGVTEGFEKKLELIGVGYRAKASGKLLELTLGFSHPIKYQLPDEVERIEKAGGIFKGTRLFRCTKEGEKRHLGMTRSIGDFYYKDQQKNQK